jgi:UDP:flavonoid glycosyltransferase YjiC (YdhE family)
MKESIYSNKKPLIGFFPTATSLADTGRLVMIAKRYRDLGGKSIFFSHGLKYENIPKENGFKVKRVNPILSEEEIKKFWELTSNTNIKNYMKTSFFTKKWIEENVKNEIDVFKKTGINMIVSAYNYTCSISARAAKIPYISILADMGFFNIRVPDAFENFFTRRLPQSFKVRILNWYTTRAKMFLRSHNKVAKKYNITPFKHTRDLLLGDYNLETNAIEFINIFPNQLYFPPENYIGPILLDGLFTNKSSNFEKNKIENEIKLHLKKPEKSIFVNLGSVGHEKLILKILKTLNETNYKIIVLYNQTLNKNELKPLNNNILVKKFIPSIEKIHEMVDLSIIHGGQGTVYAAAYAGKPIIGFPYQGEQVRNIEKFAGHGSGLILSTKYFNKKQLISGIKQIFSNYNKYLNKAQKLAKNLPPPKGDKNAVRRIIEIYNINKNIY